MNSLAHTSWSGTSESRTILWMIALIVGAVFFYLGSDIRISTIEGWTPWEDSLGTFHSKNTGFRGAVYGIVALLGIYCLLRTDDWRPSLTGLGWLVVAFVAWCTVSLLWSHDVRVTVIRLGVLAITCVASYGFSRVLRPAQWIPLALSVLGVYLLIGVAAEMALGTFRPWASGYRFAGTVHPNEQGASLAIFSLGAYCQLKGSSQRRMFWTVLLGIAIGFMLLTKSRSAYGSFIVAVILLECLISPSRKPLLACVTLLWAFCVVALIAAAAGWDISEKIQNAIFLGRQDESEGLTGRIPLWTVLMPFVRAEALTGYGFESFWTGPHIEAIKSEVFWTVRDAHSLYLNMVLSVGMIGLGLFLWMILASLLQSARLFRVTRDSGYAFLCCLIVSLLARGALETTGGLPGFSSLLLCCGVSYLAFPPSRQVSTSSSAKHGLITRSFMQPSATF